MKSVSQAFDKLKSPLYSARHAAASTAALVRAAKTADGPERQRIDFELAMRRREGKA
jgi:hypothetical protein